MIATNLDMYETEGCYLLTSQNILAKTGCLDKFKQKDRKKVQMLSTISTRFCG